MVTANRDPVSIRVRRLSIVCRAVSAYLVSGLQSFTGETRGVNPIPHEPAIMGSALVRTFPDGENLAVATRSSHLSMGRGDFDAG